MVDTAGMKEMKNMQNRQAINQRHGMTLGDIYYILFRQKWKVLFFCALGVAVGCYLYESKPPLFESDAKLFIRYVLESRTPGPPGDESKMISPDGQGVNIINSEVEILTSYDLALQVADVIGPERILAKSGGGKDRNLAASLIAKNLVVDSATKGSVIRVAFRSLDPEVVQPVLRQMIEGYFKKHVEIHQTAGGFDDFLTQQKDQLRARLEQTEAQLRKARQGAGVISLEETRKAYTMEISKIRQEIFNTEADLAERQAALTEINPGSPGAANTTTGASGIPVGQIDEYKSVVGRLALLWKRQQEFLTQYTEDSSPVKDVRVQIADTQKLQEKLEKANPKLAGFRATLVKTNDRQEAPAIDLNLESARIVALQAKIKVLNSQLGQIRTDAANMDASEGGIVELQRTKELDEANYRYFSANLEQARFDEALGAGKVSNISVIQNPSPPFKDGLKTLKNPVTAMIACIGAGIALAFLIEMRLDRSVKRPVDIESKLLLPLFLSIPRTKISSRARADNDQRLLAAAQPDINAVAASESIEMRAEIGGSLWSRDPALNPYYEALRDRIILDFELRELTHAPKLIAVTGCDRGSGVTTVALGLAASLSETGAGNVLLVD